MIFQLALLDAVTALVAVIVLMQLHRRERELHLRMWAAAFALQGLASASVLHQSFVAPIGWLMGVSALAGFGTVVCLVIGTSHYLQLKPARWWLVMPLGALTVSMAALALGASFAWYGIPVIFLMGASLILMGAALLRSWKESIGSRVAGLGLVLNGVHIWDYPLLVSHPEWLSWGYAVATLLQFVIAVGFVLLYLERAHRRLARREAHYRALFESAAVGIFVADSAGTVTAANDTLHRILGLEHGALVGRPLTEICARGPDLQRLIEEYTRLSSGTRTEWRGRGGQRVPVQVHAKRADIDSDDFELEGVVIDARDQDALERRMNQVQRTEILGQLAGGIAHDINNVLTVVLTNAAVLERTARGEDRTLLRGVQEAAKQGSHLTRQLLTFTRRHPMATETLELGALVRRSVEMLGPTLGETVTIELSAQTDGCGVRADPALVEQLVVNLVLNARDALGGDGAVAVEVRQASSEDPTPEGWTHPAADSVLLRVTDEGVGMDESTLARVFEPFFTTKEASDGTGLGLSVVQRVVQRAGGAVTVESQAGRGSQFTVWLPRAAEAVTAPVPEEERASEARTRPTPVESARLLVVEDRADVRRVLVTALSRAGFELVAPDSSREAIRLLADGEEFDLLVTDVRMPGHSGVEVAGAFRRARTDAPVVFVSGFADEKSISGGQDPRTTRFLSKPFLPRDLVAAVRDLVARARLPERTEDAPSEAAR